VEKGKLKDLFKEITKGKRLMVIGIIGIVLIGISSFSMSDKKEQKAEEGVSVEDYRQALEEEIKEIVVNIVGDKKVNVVVTLETGFRREYAGETEDSVNEKKDGEENNLSTDKKEKAITVKASDGSEQALVVTEYMPQIRGVAIVIPGQEKAEIKEEVSAAVTAALNITSKRVYIANGGNKR